MVIAGEQFWLWRAVDNEGEVLDLLVQRRRDKAAAVKLRCKLLKKQGFAPDVLVADKLRSYGAAKAELGLSARHEQGLRKNNRAENSHQPTRRTCATEAEFERAVKYAQAWTRLISATLPDGTVLNESELRRRYGPAQQPPPSHAHPVANSNSGNGNLRPETFETRRK